MNRRHFLKLFAGAAVSVATASAVGPITRSMVTAGYMDSPWELFGDGYTDDSEAMQALTRGHNVIYRGNIIEGANRANNFTITMPAGRFNVSNPIVAPYRCTIQGSSRGETCFMTQTVLNS